MWKEKPRKWIPWLPWFPTWGPFLVTTQEDVAKWSRCLTKEVQIIHSGLWRQLKFIEQFIRGKDSGRKLGKGDRSLHDIHLGTLENVKGWDARGYLMLEMLNFWPSQMGDISLSSTSIEWKPMKTKSMPKNKLKPWNKSHAHTGKKW